MNLSEIKSKDCITVWYGCNPYMQSNADYILYQCLNFKKGYYLTHRENEKITKDISIEQWLKQNMI